MNYKEHTKQRFKEKFRNNSIKELTDDDYYEICNLCRNKNILLEKKNKNGGKKMIINYNNVYMWCILSNKSKIVKTIYPIDNCDRNYLNI